MDAPFVETTFHVRYAETDAMRQVHHSVYPVWFEEARSELMRHLGSHYAEVEAAGYYFTVTEMWARFHAPARYGHAVTVRGWVEEVRSRGFTFRYEVRHADNGQRLVTGQTKHICMDREGNHSSFHRGCWKRWASSDGNRWQQPIPGQDSGSAGARSVRGTGLFPFGLSAVRPRRDGRGVQALRRGRDAPGLAVGAAGLPAHGALPAVGAHRRRQGSGQIDPKGTNLYFIFIACMAGLEEYEDCLVLGGPSPPNFKVRFMAQTGTEFKMCYNWDRRSDAQLKDSLGRQHGKFRPPPRP